jgi:hypothetical protein
MAAVIQTVRTWMMRGYDILTPQLIVLALGILCMVIVFGCVPLPLSRLIMFLILLATVLAIVVSMAMEFNPDW